MSVLNGSAADDRLFGGFKTDSIAGGSGDDWIEGKMGDDRLYGNEGNDYLFGGMGSDTVYGGAGNDTIGLPGSYDRVIMPMDFWKAWSDGAGQSTAADVIYGDEGDDFIYVDFPDTSIEHQQGGLPSASVFGGADNDLIEINGNGHVWVDAGSGNDDVSLNSNYSGSQAQAHIELGDGDDGFYSWLDSERVLNTEASVDGGSGDDVITLVDGRTWTVNGGSGNDFFSVESDTTATISGGLGSDIYMVMPQRLTQPAITVHDFATGPGGDLLNLNYLGDPASPVADPFAAGLVRLRDTAYGCQVQVLYSAPLLEQPLWKTAVLLEGVRASDLQPDNFVGGLGAGGTSPSITVNGGLGDDSLSGQSGSDSLQGMAGHDVLEGNAGNDTLVGGDGNDLLLGGIGDDRFYGGLGNDSFGGGAGISPGTGVAVENGDFADGGAGDDTFYLRSRLAGAVTVYGGDGNDSLLSVSGDWRSYGNAEHVAVFDAGAGNDLLDLGSIFSARISASYGDDTVSVRMNGGKSTIAGGEGNDRLTVERANLRYSYGEVVLAAGAGHDAISVWAQKSTVTGGTGNDTIRVFDGLSTISGGEGSDLIALPAASPIDEDFPASGPQVIITDFQAGTGGDVLDLEHLLASQELQHELAGNPFASSTPAAYRLRFVDTAAGCELRIGSVIYLQLQGVKSADLKAANFLNGRDPRATAGRTATGSSSAEVLRGTWAQDELAGADGQDTLIGLAAADRLDGGAGDDVLNGGQGNDVLIGGAGNDELIGGTGIDYLYGGSGNDILRAGADSYIPTPRRNYLDGGIGADTMYGSFGDDTYIVRDSNDLIFDTWPKNIILYEWDYSTFYDDDHINAYASFNMDARAELVESLTLMGSANLKVWGNDLRNELQGNSGNNLLDGGANYDQLFGNAGADTLIGSLGSDTLNGGLGGDTYYAFETAPAPGGGTNSEADVISEFSADGSVDQLHFADTFDYRRLWLQKEGDDLRLRIMGSGQNLLIDNWYQGTESRIEQFRLGDGTVLSDAQVDLLVNAMAGMGGPAQGQTILTQSQQQQLQQVLLAAGE